MVLTATQGKMSSKLPASQVKKRGPRYKSESRKLNERIQIRCTLNEKDILAVWADKQKLPVGGAMRTLALALARKGVSVYSVIESL